MTKWQSLASKKLPQFLDSGTSVSSASWAGHDQEFRNRTEEGASFGEREKERYRGWQSSSCSWRRYASHETKLIEKKQFVEGWEGGRGGGGGGSTAAAEERGLLKESIPSLVAATRAGFSRLQPNSIRWRGKKEEK